MHCWLTGALQVETLTVPILGLPRGCHGLKLVQLSDFHFGRHHLSVTLLQQAIAVANAAMADFVVLTGDYVMHDPEPIDQLAEHLQALQSRWGTYAVLGNHDHLHPQAAPRICRALQGVGIEVLCNRIVYPGGPGLALAGLSDYFTSDFNPQAVMAQLPSELPRIVLSHNPDTARTLQRWRVDLQLSGHTHGGQIVVPGHGPLLPRLQSLGRWLQRPCRVLRSQAKRKYHKAIQNWEWSQGLHHVQKNLLYVNRGLGTHPPGRVCCPPEVTIITLIEENGDRSEVKQTRAQVKH